MPKGTAMTALVELPDHWEDPEALSLMLEKLLDMRPDADVRRLRLAYYVAEEAHRGQTRLSGEPYISHPLAVADILVDIHVDDDTIVAGLLHDVLEDCPNVSPELIRRTFGEDVLRMVEGVTKLSFRSLPEGTALGRITPETHRAAETLRKMLLAMANDIRVMVIKLADRLHNMRTLDSMPPEKRTRIANETLDIYAPLAGRLGIWQLKWQLEDLAFKHLHPREFQEVSELVAKSRRDRERYLQQVIVALKERLEERGLKGVEVNGRPKHLYSIFNKMVKQGLDFKEILDLIAIRVITQSTPDCYLALGIVHDLWMPIPGLFSDYIAKPKPNGYQSLHTKVMGPGGEPIEVQIRTRAMHEVAEFGIAAHWAYKEGQNAASDDKMRRLRQQLFDWSSDSRTSSDFLRSLSTDLFSEQVFVFTPKGDVLDLPQGSTPVDFAFRVHTELGLQTVGAKVNGHMVPLNTQLQNGDVVELITRSNATPSLQWLEFVKSAHTRNKLRAYFRKRNKAENAQRGKEAIERELRALKLDPREFLGEEKLQAVAEALGIESSQEMLAKVGEGLRSVQSVVNRLRGIETDQPSRANVIQTQRSREGKVTLVKAGVDNVMVRRAKCCDPIPGDEVVGFVTRGKGIMIHRKVCPNAQNLLQTDPERLIPLEWPPDGSVYPVQIKIVSTNRQGLLMDVSVIFGESKTNVSAARIRTLPNQTAEIEVTLDVADLNQLNTVMNKISNFSDVISILRMFGRTGAK